MWHAVTPLVLAGAAFCVQAQIPSGVLATNREAILGAHLAAQVRARTTPIRLASVDSYLLGLSRNLAEHLPNRPESWELTLVKEPGGWTHEPLALPGGYVFIPASLMLSAQSEAEFAGMLVRAMAKTSPLRVHGLATVPLIVLGGDFGLDGKGGEPLLPLGLVALQQKHELEADAAAARIMTAAGFDPNALLQYIERTQPELRAGWAKPSALPPRNIRLEALRQIIEGQSIGERKPSSPSFGAAQESVRLTVAATAVPRKVPSLLHPEQ